MNQGQAAITGQWDFKAGSLAATIGQDMSYLNTDTQTGTSFGTTTSFSIPDIGGQPTNVMKFPKAVSEFGGYYTIAGAGANGGGSFVNQYTIIMDVLFPTNSSSAMRALVVTDQGGELYVDANNALGFAGGFGAGSLTPNVWHRVAFAVDTASTISMFIDGVKAGEQPTPPAWMAGSPWAALSICLMIPIPIHNQGLSPACSFRTRNCQMG